MPTATRTEVRAIKDFGERLQRVFKRCQDGERCTCGLAEGHLPGCPQHQWEVARLLTQMELEDTARG